MLLIPFSFACNCGKQLFWIQKWRTQEQFFNSAVETSLLELERLGGMSRVLRNEKVKAISILASRQDLFAVLKRYPTFTSCQNAACLVQYVFFSLVGRLCSGGFYVLTKQILVGMPGGGGYSHECLNFWVASEVLKYRGNPQSWAEDLTRLTQKKLAGICLT